MLQAHKNNGTTLSSGYRYSFNGKEKIDEVAGSGNTIDFGARIYDARVGRWLSRDPLEKSYPSNSTYSYASNNSIYYIDRQGKYVVPTDEFTRALIGDVITLQIGAGQTQQLLYNNLGMIHNLPTKADLKHAMRADGLNFSERKTAMLCYESIVSQETVIVQGVTFGVDINGNEQIQPTGVPTVEKARRDLQKQNTQEYDGVTVRDENETKPDGKLDAAEWKNPSNDFTIGDPLLYYKAQKGDGPVAYDTDGSETAIRGADRNIYTNADLIMFALPATPQEFIQIPNFLTPGSPPILLPVTSGSGTIVDYNIDGASQESLDALINLIHNQTHESTP